MMFNWFKNKKLRDSKNIYPLLKADLSSILGDVKIAAIGSRTSKKVLGRNDFDLLIQMPSENQLFTAPLCTPSLRLFVLSVTKFYTDKDVPRSQIEKIIEVYRNRIFPLFYEKWRELSDEFGHSVEVDITFTDGEFPDNAVLL